MSLLTHPITMPTPFVRSVAIAALLGATMLATPLSMAHAGPLTNAASQLAQAACDDASKLLASIEDLLETIRAQVARL